MALYSLYRQAQLRAWSGQVNWVTDNIVMTQHTSFYEPDLDADAFVSDLADEVPAGLGYIQGGLPLLNRSARYFPADGWPSAWSPVTVYQAGQVVRPQAPAGFLFRCITAGTSGAGAPAWPAAIGSTISDGSAAWGCIAAGAVALLASPVQWLSYSASVRYLVVSDRTPASPSAQPLIALLDLGTTYTGSGGNFDANFDPAGAIVLWPS